MVLRALIVVLMAVSLSAAEPGEPLTKSPYPANLDRAATGKWWEVAQKARDGAISIGRHTTKKNTVTGRHFLDLEVPRDEVVCFALYTLHDRTLKMSAQLYPLFPDETRDVRLEVKRGDAWEQVATAKINDLGWSALFRVEDWDDTQTLPYRVLNPE